MAGPYECDICGAVYNKQRSYASHHKWCVIKHPGYVRSQSPTANGTPETAVAGNLGDAGVAPGGAAASEHPYVPPEPHAADTLPLGAGASVPGAAGQLNMDSATLQSFVQAEVKRTIDAALQQAQAARAAQFAPKGPAGMSTGGMTPPPPPGEGEVNWADIAKKVMDMFENWRQERRAKLQPTQPNLAETVGNLSIQRYVMQLSSEAGKMGGRNVGKASVIIDPAHDDEAVGEGIISYLQGERQARESFETELVDKLSGIAKSLGPKTELVADADVSEHGL